MLEREFIRNKCRELMFVYAGSGKKYGVARTGIGQTSHFTFWRIH